MLFFDADCKVMQAVPEKRIINFFAVLEFFNYKHCIILDDKVLM